MEVRMDLSHIMISEKNDMHMIVLKERDGARRFPIWIGLFEAVAIDRKVKEIQHPRPLTHDLLISVIRDLGGALERVVVCDLRDQTFFAKLVVDRDGETVEIDCRPSDAIALAVSDKTPIFVEDHVLDQVAGS